MKVCKTVDELVLQIKEDFDGECWGRPTDIIGFGEKGRLLAERLEALVGVKEICFYDKRIKEDEKYHYLDFEKMIEKSEIMIVMDEGYLDLIKGEEGFDRSTRLYFLDEGVVFSGGGGGECGDRIYGK